MKILRRTQFGNPILRQKARWLTPAEITSEPIRTLIADMRHTLTAKKYGVGLAAPQVGHSLAISIIDIHPTETRPKAQIFQQVIINPEITKTYGKRQQKWEGCISFGGSRDTPFAKVPRYPKIHVSYLDEQGKQQQKDLEGLPAQVFQHETDHLNGFLFVERVIDPTTYVTLSEYKKRYRQQ